MSVKPSLWALCALCTLFGASALLPASAQTTIYKCWSKGSVVYTEKPCSKQVVKTDGTAAPVKPNPKGADLQRIEQNRIMARSMRRRVDESAEQFETRRHRAKLMQTDRDECARIDVRMPVEEASMKNPNEEEVAKAEAALQASRKRFAELGC